MKKIGTCNGRTVLYSNGVVRVKNTDVVIYGCKDEKDAIERSKKNLNNFKEDK